MATLPGHSHDNTSGNRGKSGESNLKQIESIAADERKHTQDCWQQFAETDSRHRKLMESKVEECHEVKAIVPEVKIGRGDSWG